MALSTLRTAEMENALEETTWLRELWNDYTLTRPGLFRPEDWTETEVRLREESWEELLRIGCTWHYLFRQIQRHGAIWLDNPNAFMRSRVYPPNHPVYDPLLEFGFEYIAGICVDADDEDGQVDIWASSRTAGDAAFDRILSMLAQTQVHKIAIKSYGMRGPRILERLPVRVSVETLSRKNTLGFLPDDPYVEQWTITGDVWKRILQIVPTHPSLQRLTLEVMIREEVEDPGEDGAVDARKRRAREVVDMVKATPSLFFLHLPRELVDEEIMRDEIQPRLIVNEYRSTVQAIANEKDASRKWRMLGEALVEVHDDPTLTRTFMLVAANIDAILEHSDTIFETAEMLSRNRKRKTRNLIQH